jgi:hypothetical protein
VRGLGDFWMVTEAALELDLAPSKLRRWISGSDSEYWPSRSVKFGKTTVYLYTREDIDRIRAKWEVDSKAIEFNGKRGRGRPKVYTKGQRAVRAQLQSRRNYWRLRAEEAMFRDDKQSLEKAVQKIKEITERLEGMTDGVRD